MLSCVDAARSALDNGLSTKATLNDAIGRLGHKEIAIFNNA